MFLVVFFLLIMQGRQKNKIMKPIAGEQLEEAGEIDNIDAERHAKKQIRPSGRQTQHALDRR